MKCSKFSKIKFGPALLKFAWFNVIMQILIVACGIVYERVSSAIKIVHRM